MYRLEKVKNNTGVSQARWQSYATAMYMEKLEKKKEHECVINEHDKLRVMSNDFAALFCHHE